MNWFAGKKLLVPIDFSDLSHQALDMALEMADATSHVHAIHVAPDLDVTTPGVVWETMSEDVQRKNVEQSIRKTFADAKYKGITFNVSFGDAGRQIVEYAENGGIDMIVMPSHGRSGLSRLLLGSVAERVLRFAHCPVLILRNLVDRSE